MASSSATAPPVKGAGTASASSPMAGSSAAARQRVAPNGVSNRPKSRNEPKPIQSQSSRETNGQDKHAHDRMIFLLAACVGQTATITTKNGEQYTGIFAAGASLDPVEYVLKMTKKISPPPPQTTNGVLDSAEDYVGTGDEHTMIFELNNVVDLFVQNVTADKVQTKLSNGVTGSFKTDTDISGNLATRERELQAWQPSADSNVDLSLNGSGREWDQFETNERLYGVRTDYDENLYTTRIDRSHPSYRERAAAADRLAREIEGTATNNIHLAEERGQVTQSEEDEEARFSGVRRDFPPLSSTSSQGNKYTPPARRAPTGQPTVPGAPVDPAIISSQLMRPQSPKSPSPLPATSPKKENAEPTPAAGVTPLQAEPTDASNPPPLKDTSPLKPLSTTATAGGARTQTSGKGVAVNVENEVLDSFKSFAANEKLRMQERQRANQKKEKEVKLNDLKKFSMNFKLKTAVPQDMLGILARDQTKQDEIVEKSQRQLEEQQTSTRTITVPSEQQTPKAPVAPRSESTQASPVANIDRTPQKNNRGQPPQHFHTARPERQLPYPVTSPRGPGGLGPRLAQYHGQQLPQYNKDRQAPGFIPTGPADARGIPQGPAAINTELNMPRSAGVQTPSSTLSARFNVQAMEFRPNPAATTFQPSTEQSTRTTTPVKPAAESKPVNKVSFFADKKPRPVAERRSIRDAFNPIARMKKENAAKKDFAANGGIPQAYRTGPVWEPPQANANKSWQDMFEKIPTGPAAMPSNAIPHQHQLPPHLQSGPHPMSHGHSPHQSHNMQHQFSQNQGRDPNFDDYRMHASSSNSSVHPSPGQRFGQPMMGYQNQIIGQMQPGFIQSQYPMAPNGQHMAHMRQYPGSGNFANAQGLMATPMMPNNSTGGTPFAGMQMAPQIYSPGPPGHVLPSHVAPAGGMPSPRGGHMMVHQNSQQAPGQYVYMSGQHPSQMFGPQPQMGPMQQSRGGFPMVNQHSFGSSPHMPSGFPQQPRGMQFGGQMPGQQMHPMQVPNPGPHMNQGGDHDT